jgi:hypothetical protein
MEKPSLRRVCLPDDMPAESTVRLWVSDPKHPFSAQYARAREIGYLRMADELLDIADDGTNDFGGVDDDGEERVNSDHITRSRLRVDTRKWLLSKCLPKIYGEKVENRHVGADGGAIEIKDESASARRVAFMLGRAIGRQENVKTEEKQS